MHYPGAHWDEEANEMSNEEPPSVTWDRGPVVTVEYLDAWLAGQGNGLNHTNGAGYEDAVPVSLPPFLPPPCSSHPRNLGIGAGPRTHKPRARPRPQFSGPPSPTQEVTDGLHLPRFCGTVNGAVPIYSGPSRYPPPYPTASQPIQCISAGIDPNIDSRYQENISFPTWSGNYSDPSLPQSFHDSVSRPEAPPPQITSQGLFSSPSAPLSAHGGLYPQTQNFTPTPTTSQSTIVPEQSLPSRPYGHITNHHSHCSDPPPASAWLSDFSPPSTNAFVTSQASPSRSRSGFSIPHSDNAWLVSNDPTPDGTVPCSREIQRSLDWMKPSNHTSSNFTIALPVLPSPAVSAISLPSTHTSEDYFAESDDDLSVVGYISSLAPSPSMDYCLELDFPVPFHPAAEPPTTCASNPLHNSIDVTDSQPSSSDWTSPSTPSDQGASGEAPSDDSRPEVVRNATHPSRLAFRKFMPPYKAPTVREERKRTGANADQGRTGKARSQRSALWKPYTPYVLADGKLGRHQPRKREY